MLTAGDASGAGLRLREGIQAETAHGLAWGPGLRATQATEVQGEMVFPAPAPDRVGLLHPRAWRLGQTTADRHPRTLTALASQGTPVSASSWHNALTSNSDWHFQCLARSREGLLAALCPLPGMLPTCKQQGPGPEAKRAVRQGPCLCPACQTKVTRAPGVRGPVGGVVRKITLPVLIPHGQSLSARSALSLDVFISKSSRMSFYLFLFAYFKYSSVFPPGLFLSTASYSCFTGTTPRIPDDVNNRHFSAFISVLNGCGLCCPSLSSGVRPGSSNFHGLHLARPD